MPLDDATKAEIAEKMLETERLFKRRSDAALTFLFGVLLVGVISVGWVFSRWWIPAKIDRSVQEATRSSLIVQSGEVSFSAYTDNQNSTFRRHVAEQDIQFTQPFSASPHVMLSIVRYEYTGYNAPTNDLQYWLQTLPHPSGLAGSEGFRAGVFVTGAAGGIPTPVPHITVKWIAIGPN